MRKQKREYLTWCLFISVEEALRIFAVWIFRRSRNVGRRQGLICRKKSFRNKQ